MLHAETVTFGGSGLDRAAELRGDPKAIEAADKDAQVILLWRGKPLVDGEGRDRLARLPAGHAVARAGTDPILLGREEGGALIFARDLSAWRPADLDEATLGQFLDNSEQRHPDLPDSHIFAELRRIMTRLDARDAELATTAKALFAWHDSHRFCARCGEPSTMSMAGWQRDCPSCSGAHFPRTDPVVIMLITRGNAVLVGRSRGWPAGMYSLLAGFVEPGETIEAAVRREVFEESGIQVGRVGYLACQPWAFPSSLMLGCRGEALTGDIRIDPNEIEDAIWVSREDMLSAMAGQHPTILPARKGAIAHFLLRNWLADRLD